jgi:TPR repeat protein
VGPGDRIASYRIRRVLGHGGMGVVYEAEDQATGRLVALKVILAEHARDEKFMKRFRVEAQAAAAIIHPHVTTLFQAGDHETRPGERVPFLAFELVSGGTLEGRLAKQGPLPWREACARGAEVASALGELHARGLVHRDLKPGNVLLDANGRAKLADLGLVRRDPGMWQSMTAGITREGELLGTLAYMSPEQAEGKKDIDARADLYSLGALLFALLTGRPPFEGHGMDILTKLYTQAAPSPRELAPETPVALERLVLRLLAKDPAGRPASALEVGRALDQLARGQEKATSSRGVRGLVVLLPVVLLLGIAGAWFFLGKKDEPPVHREPPPAVPDGRGIAKGESDPTELLRRAARAGDPVAMNRLAEMLNLGKGVSKDEAEAVLWFRKAAEAGERDGMENLAVMLAEGRGVAQDDAEAAAWFRKAAEAGQLDGIFNFGVRVVRGEGGLAKDEAEGARWLQKAAEQGHTLSIFWLGRLIETGGGNVPRDDVKALRLFRKGAELGHAGCMVRLGQMISDGRGTAPDDLEAVRWYRKAGEGGEPWGWNNLSSMYLRGRGVEKDEVEAAACMRRAAEGGLGEGMFYLGQMLELGLGVTKDEDEAVRWYRKAAAANVRGARDRLQKLGLGE